MKRVFIYNVAFLLTGIFLLELIFGTWIAPSKIGGIQILRNFDAFYPLGDLYESSEPMIHYKRDQYGFRGRYRSPAEIDVLTIGGSTTDQRYVTEGQTWQDRLADGLSKSAGREISVVNAGIDGRSTYGHLKDFESWFPRVPSLRPKYILLYEGINDLVSSPTYAHDQVEYHPLWKTGIYWVLDNSALVHAGQTLLGNFRAKYVYELGHARTRFESLKWTSRPLLHDHEKLFAGTADAYAERLLLLDKKIRKLGARPIFVTQVKRSYKQIANNSWVGVDREMQWRDGKVINGVDERIFLNMLNERTLEVCSKVRGLCLDLREVSFQDADFYDFAHNTPSGAEKIASFLENALAAASISGVPEQRYSMK